MKKYGKKNQSVKRTQEFAERGAKNLNLLPAEDKNTILKNQEIRQTFFFQLDNVFLSEIKYPRATSTP